MKLLGLIPTNAHRLPMMPAAPELEEQLEAVVKRYRLAVKRTKVSS
jgi:dihydrodipicolinate synthase/N-acetylneuraminate lyase